MAANERSALLPRHRSDDFDETAVSETEANKRSSKCALGYSVLIGILALSLGTAILKWKTTENHDSRPSSSELQSAQKDIPLVTAQNQNVDEQVNQWERWKRLEPLESSAGSSLPQQHVQTANQIIDWEFIHGESSQGEMEINSEQGDVRGKASEIWHQPQHFDSAEGQVNPQTPSQDGGVWRGVKASVGDGVKSIVEDAEDQLNKFVEVAGETLSGDLENTESFLNSTLFNVENEEWWEEMSDWFKNTWTTFADDAHTVWLKMATEAQTDEEKLWNATVSNERIWYATSIANMRKLGTNMRQWWSEISTSVIQNGVVEDVMNVSESDGEVLQENFEDWMSSTEDEEGEIQRNFADWWNSTQDQERVWWKHTRDAFKSFSRKAGEKEKLWWQMVRHSVVESWNDTEETVHEFWNEASEETRDRFDYTKHEIAEESRAVWNATVSSEVRMWHAIQKWFTSHATYIDELSQPLLYLNTTATFEMLTNGYGWFDYSNDFFMMQQGWDAQINQAYCAVASATTVLNSLKSVIAPPVDPLYKPYHYATQTGILTNSCVNDNVVRYNSSFDGIFHAPGGLSLRQARDILECHLPRHDFDIVMRRLDPAEINLDQFRMELTEALRDPKSRIIINYDRKAVGQIGGGHFSPLGSYYQTEDRFLIMDVAKYKYPPSWVPAAKLYASLSTIDTCGESSVPAAQDHVSTMPLNNLASMGDAGMALYRKQLVELGCKPTYRGYIIIRSKRENINNAGG